MKRTLENLLPYAVAVLLVILAVGPALWLVNVAVQPASVALTETTPVDQYTLFNFKRALGISADFDSSSISEKIAIAWERGMLRPLANSIVVAVLQTTLNVLLAALAAYPLARMKFAGRSIVFVIILATLMVPEQVVTISMFVTISDLGLVDTLAGVILPGSVTAFGIYLCRSAFLAIPGELEEAARIDGAGPWLIWRHVMLPLAKPTLATLAVFSLIGSWSNLLWPIIVLQTERNFTLPVYIDSLMGTHADNVRYAYAGSVMALVPMVLAYLAAQKWLQRGMLAGAVKG